MITIDPNHVDLDLHCPIGWSNSQTHILHIKSPSTKCPIAFISCHSIRHDLYIYIYIYIHISFDSHIIYYDFI